MVAERRSADTWTLSGPRLLKSTKAFTVPSPRKNVSLPARNDGSHEEFCTSTTTWNSPLAASKRLSSLIDFSSTGLLRVVVVSPNGLRQWIRLVTAPGRVTTRSEEHC